MIFRINGGDGDQSFFGRPFLIETCDEDWFDEDTPRGKGILVRIISGDNLGLYLVITSKVTASIEYQVSRGNWASVIVHTIAETGKKFEASLDNVNAIGMAAIQRLS